MTQESMKGNCLCKAVQVTTAKASRHMSACHCGMCRKWGGGPYLSVNCGENVVFEGEDSISVYASSRWAERGFCKNCGTHLFYRYRADGKKPYMMPAGLFDNDDFELNLQIFTDKKPAGYEFVNDTRQMTEAEIMAAFTTDN